MVGHSTNSMNFKGEYIMTMQKTEILKETAKRNSYPNVQSMLYDCKVYPTVR